MDTIVNAHFISEKISKIRWIPETLKDSNRFLTGTWDMSTNFLRIWRFQGNEYPENFNDCVPRSSDKIPFVGDITGLEFVTDDVVATTCTDGHLSLVKIKRAVEEDVLEIDGRSNLLHKFDLADQAAPCTGLSIYAKDAATVGEDGRLNIIDCSTLREPRCVIEADSCALTAVAYINPQEVLTANRMGVIRIFDVRTAAKATEFPSFMISSEDDKRSNSVTCLGSHPTQQHVVLAGSEEGSITVWDLRQPGIPASYLSAHTSAITELAFHHTDPTKLFTASEDGEMWLWSQHMVTSIPSFIGLQKEETENPWLSGERAKNRISVTALISDLRKPINSFDSNGSKIICSSDSEAIYLIDNIL
ncbi:nucleoporin Nup43-like [Teleopsis dalmanni]|uniref:nucleoporin Nup43-like n=1 Tax=Teleopsis dalmanni TaxID=139649 RepID=UPI000D32BD79|nr:nucleoporin Nup43-like [Teleopsis dalmanni]